MPLGNVTGITDEERMKIAGGLGRAEGAAQTGAGGFLRWNRYDRQRAGGSPGRKPSQTSIGSRERPSR
jgi:hypothetical protein